jgi:hypothetical protein
MELVNVNESVDLKKNVIVENIQAKNLDTFKEICDEDCIDTLMQNILNVEQVVDDNDKSITIAPREGFQPLGLFHDVHSKEYNFSMLFFGHSRPSFACTYQKVIQT